MRKGTIKKLLLPYLTIVALLCASFSSYAEEDDLNTLNEQISAIDDEIEQLESEKADLQAKVEELEGSAAEMETEALQAVGSDFEETDEGQVLIDNDECSVTLTGMEEGDPYTISLCLENKSSDVEYMFSASYGAINGLEISPYFAEEVAPGKKSNEKIEFRSFSDYGIEEVTDITLFFRVYDSDDWSADDIFDEPIHIYPFGEENSVQYEREPQESDIVLTDTEDATVIVTDFNEEDHKATLFLVNKTDVEAMFSVNDVSVNGLMLDPFWSKSVPAGICSYSSMSWSGSSLEDSGITDFTEIEMELQVYNYDDWSADDFVKEIVYLYPLGEDNAAQFEREPQDSDVTLAETEDVTVIITGIEESDREYAVNLFLVNKTDSTLMYTVDDVSVNGYMVDPFWSKSVCAGKSAFSSMSWSESKLEENDITDINEIEMTLRIYDYNDWSADDIYNEIVTINP